MKFLRKAALLPIYFDSSGYVINPTRTSVDTKVPTCAYPAPLDSKVLPSEKATKVGIIVIEPRIAERIIPKNPEFAPMIFEIVSALRKASNIPTVTTIKRN